MYEKDLIPTFKPITHETPLHHLASMFGTLIPKLSCSSFVGSELLQHRITNFLRTISFDCCNFVLLIIYGNLYASIYVSVQPRICGPQKRNKLYKKLIKSREKNS